MRWYRHGGELPPEEPRNAPVAVGTTALRPDGYVRIKMGPGDWQLEHRVVAEREIGRPIRDDENVHHLNGDRADNRPENLVVVDEVEHQHMHEWHLRSNRVLKTCDRCGNDYRVKLSKAEESRYCSNSCRLTALHEGNRKNN